MNLQGRNLITVDDISNDEVESVFSLADLMHADIRGQSNLCKGMVMASLFYEPSTRTRLSFETAMHRLGGNVVTVADINTTSIAKGETLADTARVVSSYVDVIVHPPPLGGCRAGPRRLRLRSRYQRRRRQPRAPHPVPLRPVHPQTRERRYPRHQRSPLRRPERR